MVTPKYTIMEPMNVITINCLGILENKKREKNMIRKWSQLAK
jgi:hypothetical protein